ncbi:MAG: hypothetical protein KJN63_02665 [Acidimicrobiia bacterium]|nr:hypothetical protein [Acidimicrobiia bacterium]
MGNNGIFTSAIDFAAIGRVLADAAAGRNIEGPTFRSPPRIPGVQRSVTRNRDGSVTVAVAVRQRPVLAVLADMIDGVVLASGLLGAEAGSFYNELWASAQRWLQADNSHGPEPRLHLRVAA